MPQIELSGRCLCGQVKYAITADVKKFYLCHCEQCRKKTGSDFAANILTKPVPIQWLSGQEKVKRFDYPGDRAITNVFCTECGSRLPFLSKSGNLSIPAGSLDGDPVVRPDNNIFWSDRAPWHEDGIEAVKCDRYP